MYCGVTMYLEDGDRQYRRCDSFKVVRCVAVHPNTLQSLQELFTCSHFVKMHQSAPIDDVGCVTMQVVVVLECITSCISLLFASVCAFKLCTKTQCR